MYTLYHVLHSSTLHSINLSLTIILKRHTITPFHTEHFTIHVIEKYQRHICAATSFHAEFFTTVSAEQVLLEWILKPPPYEIFFHTQLFITHIGLKGILHQKVFYRLNLIFWIVMGCGIARFSRRGLKTTET